jgi:hypothetical protein
MYFAFKENGTVRGASASLPAENPQDYTWVNPEWGNDIKKLKNGKIRKLTKKELEKRNKDLQMAMFELGVRERAKELLKQTNHLIQNDIWFSLSEDEKRDISNKRLVLRDINSHPDYPDIDFSPYE